MMKEEEIIDKILKSDSVIDVFYDVKELPYDIKDSEVFRIESEYIQKFDSINKGFNSLISNKNVLSKSGTLFDNENE